MQARARCVAALVMSLAATGWASWHGEGKTPVVPKAASAPVDEVDFLRDVKPILAEKCLACHGPDEPEADLRLDTKEGAFADMGGYAAVVPGDREASELWYRISTEDERDRMPPKEHPYALTDAEIETLGRWIDAGALWQEHWGFAPWREPSLPQIEDPAWAQEPIDAFVRARLDEAGLQPAAPAEDLTWLRRVSFDLIGLPPTSEEIEAFLAMPAGERRAATVDRLLDSPHFGEKWARHMLDLVRYAETRGHEFDYVIPNAWEYRDYLVRAFQEDIGWDQLVREHIAGDLLTEPRLHPTEGWNESVLGTGFWFLGEAVHSPVDLEVDLADRTANQIDVFGKAFLGLTIACARCHDHKFDPIPATDYYSLAGFVQSASYRQVRFQTLESDRALRDQLAPLDASLTLDAEVVQAAAARLRATLAEIPSFRAEAAALRAEIDRQRADRVLADFEDGLPDGWVAEGEAFADPVWVREGVRARYPNPKHVGEAFLNSQLPVQDGSEADRATGLLRSAPFTIDRDFLAFRIGGGKHPDGVGVRLMIDGEAVLKVGGENRSDMKPVAWDLRRFRGREATLEIFDEVTEGWGHVTCDQFVLQNMVPELELAKERRPEAASALLAWAEMPLEDADFDAEPYAAALEAWSAPPTPLALPEDREVLWVPGDAWWQDGAAWTPHAGGPVLSAQAKRQVGWLPHPALISDPDWHPPETAAGSSHERTQVNWRGSGRTFRTPTMRLGAGPVWYLVRGKGVAFAPVEHHRILNGPLHTGTAHRFDTKGQWKWQRHDVMSRYEGLRAHFEFSPTGGWLAVAAVVQGGDTPPSELPVLRGVERILNRVDLLPPLAAAGEAEAQYYAARSQLLASQEKVSRLAPALLDGNGVDQPLLFRGETGSPRDPVPRAMLARFRGEGGAVDQLTADGQPTSGRLALAEQVLEDSGALLARVYVNRVWHYLFGRGIAPQPDNFGVLAGYPTHPDLLDQLASDLRADGWRLKPLVRRIVLSKTYGLSGEASPAAMEADPSNRLLHHLPPRRLTAEAVRDALLLASGRLDRKIGGPSIPVHLTSFMKGRGRPGSSGPVDGAGRRTIYQEIRRNFLPPFLMIWDYPTPATTMGRRSSSNVPAQSLALMNDPMVRQLAEHGAKQLAQLSEADAITELWWRALARQPLAHEQEAAAAYLQQRRDAGDDATAALAELVHVVFNLKEFVYLP